MNNRKMSKIYSKLFLNLQKIYSKFKNNKLICKKKNILNL